MAEKKLTNLRIQRAVLVDQQERTKEFIEKDRQDATLAALELRLLHVENQMTKFLEIQAEIEKLDETELTTTHRATYEETYFTQQPQLVTLVQSARGSQEAPQAHNSSLGTQSNVRLPKITLPSFSGDVTKWSDFYESYKVLIHDEQSLSNLQKYQYLKSTLSGAAAAQIASLELNATNYDVALGILKAKYGDKRIICQAHLRDLLNIKPICSNKPELIRTLVDRTNVQLRALESLGRPVNQWDDVIIHLILQKLDAHLRSAWEDKAPEGRLPTLKELLSFLSKSSDKIEASKRAQSEAITPANVKSNKVVHTSLLSLKNYCTLCKKNGHTIYKCRTFLNLSVVDRQNKIRELKLCTNCLRGHNRANCNSSYTCQVCNATHHTLLHNCDNQSIVHAHHNQLQINSLQPSTSSTSNHTALHSMQSRANNNSSYIFMPTAIVNIQDAYGNLVPCRAILDSASQLNFVSERLVQRLRLSKTKRSTVVNSIGDESSVISNRQTHVNVSSRFNNFSIGLDAVVLANITAYQPSIYVNVSSWSIPANIQLADPDFNKPGGIDLLIGAELHFHLLQVGQIGLGENLPILQKTMLGWVIAGKTKVTSAPQYSCNVASITSQDDESLDKIIKKFWELEDHKPTGPSKSTEEQLCEEHYRRHHIRNADGRFIVKIPFRGATNCLGDSTQMAVRRFINLERRLHRSPELYKEYKDFIDEYSELKHMRPLMDTELSSIKYVMPHHCVKKPDSSSTKLRVVFDASAKTTTNYSLNNIMMTGPVIQSDLFTIILNFRKHPIAITADICKMNRQILIDPGDCAYQNIVWRDHPSDKLRFYQLQTVTYGTAAAPYLATRSLLQLAVDEEGNYPLGASIIKSDFYVDDLVTGADTLDKAKEIRRQVEAVLQTGGFELKKWCSNNKTLLNEIPADKMKHAIQFHEKDVVKTLGLIWNPEQDKFNFKVSLCNKNKITKRLVLSDIARIFDPMGFINPVIVLGKIFLQQLWKLSLDWDESLPVELHTAWLKYRDQLSLIETFQIPRRIYPFNEVREAQIHAFSDASEKAYGSCIYLRCVDSLGNISVNLMCAKSRVAPIKHTTIPRLELCAAELMADLVSRIRSIINICVDALFYWTDSQIVLAWLAEPSNVWCTFVANRVAKIQEVSEFECWRYVESANNPADLVSRGALPEDFLNSNLWLNGPSFLHEDDRHWKRDYKQPSFKTLGCNERRKQRSIFVATSNEYDTVKTSKFINSFIKLQNSFVYMLRFINNSRLTLSSRHLNTISPHERDAALKAIIKVVQRKEFADDYQSLIKHGQVSKCSRLRNLTPFLDSDYIIRVGGRLKHAIITYDARHPMLLPSSHPFTKSLMTYLHEKNMHIGPQGLLATARQRFWPQRGASVAKQIVHACIRCFRTRPTNIHQVMGDLPPRRVQPARPFVNSGVDFCGPFFVHYKSRGRQPTKTYIAIFVCFATKAVHLELASDLSSGSFLAALRRFISRRGACGHLYCDNATNFIGANSELKELRDIVLSEDGRNKIIELCSKEFINFHFIPPRSPHFGGLWEAAVKYTKYHLRRVVHQHPLTYEELHTLVVQTEAILNSRPIEPMSSDPNDISALTPGHFLIGEPLTAVVEPSLKELHLNTLSRWQRVQWLQQQFWSRWSKSYLTQLQSRTKWTSPAPNVSVNSLVLIKEDNLPAMKWVLGRVVDIHPGDDGKVRVVTVKTASGSFTRAVTKICPLPTNNN